MEVPAIVRNGVIYPLQTGDLPTFIKPFVKNMETIYNYWVQGVINKEVSSLREALILDTIFPDVEESDLLLKS